MTKYKKLSPRLKTKIRDVRLLVMDVDGVLTPGYITMNSEGEEIKIFDVQDGFGLILWRRAGLKSAIVTAGKSKAVINRATSLKIDKVYQGSYNKTVVYEQLKREFKITDKEVCFIGDDLIDVPLLKRAGLRCCVSNASEDVIPYADYVTARPGGKGAVREIIELVLKTQGRWVEATKDYLG